ncbi:TA system antitoxin ParD family protein [Salinisphaera dokdonensis]
MRIPRLTLFRVASIATLAWLATRRISPAHASAEIVPSRLVEDARRDAAAANRSLTNQLERWLRMGQFLDQLEEIGYDRVQLALTGSISPDELNALERSIFDTAFEQRMRAPGPEEKEFFAELGRQQREAGFDLSKLGTR